MLQLWLSVQHSTMQRVSPPPVALCTAFLCQHVTLGPTAQCTRTLLWPVVSEADSIVVFQEAQQCAEALTAYVASAAAALPTSECEVLYGRAGAPACPSAFCSDTDGPARIRLDTPMCGAGLLYALLFAERLCPHVTLPPDLFQVRLPQQCP